MKREHDESIEKLQSTVTRVLEKVSKNNFQVCIEPFHRFQRCINDEVLRILLNEIYTLFTRLSEIT